MAGDDLTKDDLRSLARELDNSGEVELPESKGESEDTEKSESATDKVEEIESPDQDEIEKESKKAKSKDKHEDDGDGDSAESSEISDDEDKKVSKDDKDKDRLEKNWKKLEERKKAVEAKERELKEKERKQAKKPSFEEEKDGDGYSVKDYQYAAKKFRDDGDDDLATKADEAARNLYNQAFQKAWMANVEELQEEYPELSDLKKPLTIAANKVLEVLPFLRSVPDGARYAVRIAQGDNSSSMISELKAENNKLKQELGKLEKATRISGGGTYRVPAGEHDIASLPRKEGRKRLRELAEAADRGDIED